MTNAAGALISFMTAGVVPRGLGPKAYGDYGFLTNFLGQILIFFDSGTSTAFYQKLSKRHNETGIIAFYSRYVLLAFSILVIVVTAGRLLGFDERLWPGQPPVYLYMATVCVMFFWGGELSGLIADACGVTVNVEKARLLIRFIGALILLALFFTGKMTITNYFAYQYAFYLALIVFIFYILKKKGFHIFGNMSLTRPQISGYTKEFFDYSHPLILYSAIGMVDTLLCRWLLQRYHGSVQQGFYNFAFQLNAMSFIFSGSLTMLLMREFSVAFGEKDLGRIAMLFRKYIPFFYTLTAYFACFVFTHAKEVIYLFGGAAYKDALIPVMLMSFYPIHQTYGQLSCTVLTATEQTRLYRNVGVACTLIGVLLAVLLLYPNKLISHLGATGLTLKMIIMQFIAVNVYLYYNARYLKLNFKKYIAHQLIVIVIFIAIAMLVKSGIQKMPIDNIIIAFFLSGIIYSGIVALLVYKIPLIMGLKKEQIDHYYEKYARPLFAGRPK